MGNRIAGAIGRLTSFAAQGSALIAVGAVLSLSAHGPAAAQERKTLSKYDINTVVATVDGKKLTLGDLMTARPRIPPNVEVSDADKLMGAVMNTLTSAEVLARAAEKAGLADKPAMKLRLAAQRRSALGQAYLAKVAKEKITDDTLKKLYDEMMSNEVTKAPFVQSSFRLIEVETKKEADDLHKKAKGGAKFADLATKHSKHVSNKNGGLFPFHSPNPRPTPIDIAAIKMKKKGETSDVMEVAGKFYIIQLEGKRTLEFDQVKGALRKIAFDRLGASEISRLYKEYSVKPADALPPGKALLDDSLLK